MRIAFLVFDGVTALDAIGPYEVLSRLPGADVRFTGFGTGPKRTDTGALGLVADHDASDVDRADVLVIPGGTGTRALESDAAVLEWVRVIDATTAWTTSVCTGSHVLGAAGVLQGKRATTHWQTLERLREMGAEPVAERVVVDGKIVTAAGVSSGIDMALRLAATIAGDDFAQAIQLGIEYDPQPPFDAGSPSKAPEHIVQMLNAYYEASLEGSP